VLPAVPVDDPQELRAAERPSATKTVPETQRRTAR
jgi:hypothetical protein